MGTRSVLVGGLAAVLGFACGPSPDAPADAAPASERAAESPPPQWPSWGGVPWPSGDDELAVGLRQAELARDPRAPAIETGMNHADPAWRARAAWTLARIGGPLARDAFVARLGEGRAQWDATMLGAVALLPVPDAASGSPDAAWDELEDRLWTRYAVTEDPDEADALLLAIARTGGARSPTWLGADLAVLPEGDDPSRYIHAMEALAILCARGHALPPDGLRAVAQGLGSPAAEPRRSAAQTLARCAAVSAEQLAGAERGALVERLGPMAVGQDPLASRRAWAALEGLGELPTVTPGWVLGSEPTDWMAEVAAVRALAAHADGRIVIARRLPTVDVSTFKGPRLHVLRELLERLRPYAVNDTTLEEPLTALADALEAARVAAGDDAGRAKALTLVRCEAQVLLATRSGQLDALSSCARASSTIPPEHAEALVVEALVHMGSALPREQRVTMLLERAADSRPRVAAQALGALAGVDDPQVSAALRAALARGDMGVVAAAAGAVGSRASDASRRDPEAATALLSVVERFDDDHAVETRIAAIDALGRLARSESGGEVSSVSWLDRLMPLAGDPAVAVRLAARRALRGDPGRLETFDAGAPVVQGHFSPAVHQATEQRAGRVGGLRLHTDAGVVTIDVSGAPAPIAQANLATLAEQGFFDGLTFHRVVPGFVIQGGDPRGDGYGGPGHVMPCEWSSLRYRRGTVGIALAGKDTGGSQLFIAHDEPRHLDARYTVIGQVVEGLEVVDAIWPYDRIVKVEVLDRPPVVAEAAP